MDQQEQQVIGFIPLRKVADRVVTFWGRTDPKKMESFVLSNHCCDGDEVPVLVTIAQAASPHVPHAYAA